jgi:phosphoglycolate phosphatase
VNCKLLIYDLDGTLLDSGPAIAKIINEMRRAMGKKDLNLVNYFPWLSLGGVDLVKNALEVNLDEVDRYLNEFRTHYLGPIYFGENRLFPHVVETLTIIKRKKIATAICTHKPRDQVNRILNFFEIEKYFDLIIAAGDLPVKKPDIMYANECLKFFGIQPDSALLVGDSLVDQKLSDLSGIKFIQFLGGYDDGVSQENCFGIINNHIKILEYLG